MVPGLFNIYIFKNKFNHTTFQEKKMKVSTREKERKYVYYCVKIFDFPTKKKYQNKKTVTL
jgi:hypothetical protein